MDLPSPPKPAFSPRNQNRDAIKPKTRRRTFLLLFLLPVVLAAMLGTMITLWSLYSLRQENQDRYAREREDLQILIEAAQLGQQMAAMHQLSAKALKGAAGGKLDEAEIYRIHSQIVDVLAKLDQRTTALANSPHVAEAGGDDAGLMVEDFENYRNFMVMATDIAAIDPTTATGYIDKAQEYFIDFVKRRHGITARISEAALEHGDAGAEAFEKIFTRVIMISGIAFLVMMTISLISGRFLSRHLTAVADALHLMAKQTGMPPALPGMEHLQRTGFGVLKEMAAAVLAFRKTIKERHLAEDQLRKLSLAVEQSPNSTIITDLDGHIEYVNQAFVAATGYPLQEAIGKTPRILYSGKTPDSTYNEMWSTLTAGKNWQGELINQDRQGREFIDLTMISPIRQADGSISHYLSISEDITDRKALEQELEQHQLHLEDMVRERTAALKASEANLIKAREAAEEANQAKSFFLANMSHEIRTPMNAVINLSRLALASENSDKQHDYMGKVVRAGENLLGIINDILDFSKIEAGKLTIENQPFYLNRIVNDLNDVVANSARKKNLTLQLAIGEKIPHRLIGDRLRLNQVLVNLLNNAIKFTEQGEVTLTITPTKETPELIRLEFKVNDTGIGISPEHQKRLFAPFEQADPSTTRKFGGTGLGLAITRQLVELMGGDITVTSSQGRGSSFTFELEFAKATPEAGEAGPVQRSAANLARIAGSHVLLVDDNDINQEIGVALLSKVGITATVAANGVEALAALEQKHFDLVFMDLQMQVMDGYEATRQIRRHDEWRDLPVVAMTAHAMSGDRERCLAVGMNDHLTKPIDIKELHNILIRWIKPREEQHQPSPSTASADDESQLPDHLPGIELDRGLQRVAGNRSLLLKLLRRFAKGNSETIAAIHHAIEDGRREEARAMVHAVKGVAANLGAMAFYQAAGQLEKELAADNDGQPAGLTDFTEQLKNLLDGLRLLPAAPPSAPRQQEAKEVEVQAVAPLLKELLQLLDHDLGEAQNRYERLHELLKQTILENEAEKLADCLAEYDTDNAGIVVRRIASALDLEL